MAEGVVQRREEAAHGGASAFHQPRHRRHTLGAGNRAVGEGRVAVAEGFRHRHEAVPLHVPLGGFDDRLGLRVRAHQVGLGVAFLEIAADGHGFVDHRAVVQHQGGQHAARVDGAELRAEVLARRDVHLHGFDLDALLGQENAHPARVRRHLEVVEFHRCFPRVLELRTQ